MPTEITPVKPDPHQGQDSLTQSRRLGARPLHPFTLRASRRPRLVLRGLRPGHRREPDGLLRRFDDGADLAEGIHSGPGRQSSQNVGWALVQSHNSTFERLSQSPIASSQKTLGKNKKRIRRIAEGSPWHDVTRLELRPVTYSRPQSLRREGQLYTFHPCKVHTSADLCHSRPNLFHDSDLRFRNCRVEVQFVQGTHTWSVVRPNGMRLDLTDEAAESTVIPRETASHRQCQRRVLVAGSPPSSKSRQTSMTMSLPTGLRSRANPLTSALSQITLIVRGMPFECS